MAKKKYECPLFFVEILDANVSPKVWVDVLENYDT
jgi:hypothetical protein